jgi:hypothetical protein
MASKPVKLLLAALSAVFLICGGAALGLFPINLFFLKGPLAEAVLEQIGMELDVGGPMRLRLGFSPELQASQIDLRVSGSDKVLLQIDRLNLGPAIRDLLHGRLHLRHLKATGLRLDYCPETLPGLQPASRDGSSAPASVELKSLQLQDVELFCADPEKRLEILPAALNITATAARGESVGLEVESPAGSERLLSASGDSLATLLDDEADYAFRFSAGLAGARLGTKSTLFRSAGQRRLEGFFELESEEIAAMAAPFGVQLDALGPGRLSTRYSAAAELLEFNDLVTEALGMTLTGRGSAAPGGDRPRLDLELNLDQLDGDALINRFAAGEPRDDKPPAMELESLLTQLTAVDGYARILVGRFAGATLIAEPLELAAELETGLLHLTASTPSLEGSPAAAAVSVNAEEECPTLSFRLDLGAANLAMLGRLFEPLLPFGGRAESIELAAHSCGGRLAEHLEALTLRGAVRGLGATWQDQPLPLKLDAVDLEGAWQNPGSLTIKGNLLNHPVGSELTFGSLQAAWSGETWPITAALSGPQSVLKFDGTTRLDATAPELAGDLYWDVKRFGALHNWLGSNAGNSLLFRGDATVQLGKDLSLNLSDVELGRSQLSGEIEWPRPGSANGGRLYLDSRRLDLAELSTLFPAGKGENDVARRNLKEIFYDAELITRWLDLPRLDTRLTIGELLGTAFDIRDVAMKAAFSEGVARDGRLAARVDNIRVDGSVNADFREQQGSVLLDFELLNVDVGGLLSTMGLADGLDAHAERLDLRVEAAGHSLAELISEADVNAVIDALTWRFEAGPDRLQQELALDRLMLTTSRGDPLQWDAAGSINDFPIKAWMSTPSLKALFNDQQDLPLKFVMGIRDEVVMLDGILGRPTPQGRQASLTLSGARMDHADAEFAALASPLADFRLRGDFTVRPGELGVRNFQVEIGSSRAQGEASLRYVRPLYMLEARLNSAYLETDDLVSVAEDLRDSARTLNAMENEEAVDLKTRGGLTVLLGQQLENLVEKLHFDIGLGIGEFRSAGTLLGALDLHGQLNREGLVLELDTRHDRSSISLNYQSLLRQGRAENRFDLDIERLDYGGLLRLFNPDAQADGELHADIELVSSASQPGQGLDQMEGYFDLVAFPENVGAGFLDLWASNLVLALLPTGKDSGKQMNCMVARFEIENGVMKSRNTFLDSTDVIVRARGEIDLVKRELHLLVAPQAKTERFFSVSTPIEVTGPFDDFSVGVAPGGFLTTMIRWYYGLIYVPWKWLTGERFPKDGIATCYRAMDWELPENE